MAIPLTLNDADPGVSAAAKAEKDLLDFYGLEAQTRYVYLPYNNLRVRVIEMGAGDGKPLLIVPGNTGDVFPMVPLLAQLKEYRIVAVNRPGGGLSEGMDHRTVDIRRFAVETLTTVMNALKLDSADVVAHSMGAHWSLWLAMDAPERVRSLTALGNPGNVMAGGAPFMLRLLSKAPLNKLMFRLITPRQKAQALKPLPLMGHHKETLAKLPSAMSDCYYTFRQLPHYRISSLSMMENQAPRIDAEQLQQVRQPVLLLWGTKDTFASVDTGRAVAAALPHAAFHAINGAGHLPWLERPEECGKLIRDWVVG